MSKRFPLTMPESLFEKIAVFAKNEGVSIAEWIRDAIKEKIIRNDK